MGKQEISF